MSLGTPPSEDCSADLKYLLIVADQINKDLDRFLVVIAESIVPFCTAEKVRCNLANALDRRDVRFCFDVASNPEHLKEVAAIDDYLKLKRIMLGIDSDDAQKIMDKLYHPFTLKGHPVIFMDMPSVEMTKYSSNAMFATKISLMNDIANLCELKGADVNWVRKGIGLGPRIDDKFIFPGIAYGGSCFLKDVKALGRAGREYGHTLSILEAVEAVSDDQKSVLFNKINAYFGGDRQGKTIIFLGLSFKPNTDDMPGEPSIVLTNLLTQAGAHLRAYDPVPMEEAKYDLGDTITYCERDMDAVQGEDAFALITEWTEFRVPNWGT